MGGDAGFGLGIDLGLVEDVEHALHRGQRALQRVDGHRHLRERFGRLVDVLEERLEDADGDLPGDQHAAADHRDGHLRQAADEANRGAGRVGEEVRATARIGKLLGELVNLG